MIKEIPVELETETTKLLQLITFLDQDQLNTIPFEGSWTAAQLADHITKSNTGIVQSLNAEGKPARRNPEERVGEIKKTFLDFTTKMQSPDAIRPSQNIYEKEMLINNLKKSIESIVILEKNANFSEAIDHPVFREITKIEMLYFVLYHTQRHIHQLQNIIQVVKTR